MVTQSSCPLRVTWTEARSTVLGRAATTGLVRSAPTVRTAPTAWTSVRAAWTGATAVATSDTLSVLFASEQNIILYEQRATCKGYVMA